MGPATGVAVFGTHAYVANVVSMRVIDVSDPSLPVELGHHDAPGGGGGLTVAGEYLYVAESNAGMEIFNAWHCPGYVPPLPPPRRPTGRLIP